MVIIRDNRNKGKSRDENTKPRFPREEHQQIMPKTENSKSLVQEYINKCSGK